MTEFSQIRWPNSRKHILLSDKIVVEIKTLSKIDKYEVRLDRLGFDIHYQSDNTAVGKIFFVVCLIIVIASIVAIFLSKEREAWIFNSILFGFLALFGYFKHHQDDIYLVGGTTNLVFYRNIPNEQEVLKFIEKVKDQEKTYLKEKYTAFDYTTDEKEFYNRLNWLRDRAVISQTEYTEYKNRFETHNLLK
jgi:hypothetical protein